MYSLNLSLTLPKTVWKVIFLSYTFINMRKIFWVAFCAITVFLVTSYSPHRAEAAVGDIVITVTNELGASVSGATFSYFCTGGSTTSVTDGGAGDNDAAANGSITILAANAQAVGPSCGAGESFSQDDVARDGYVTLSTTLTTYSAVAQNNGTAALLFAYKITSITNELAAALTGVTVTAGDAQAIACTESGGAWYCPVPVAHTALTIKAVKDGYVTNTSSSFGSDRTANANAQVTGTVSGVLYGYKVTVRTRDNILLSGAAVAAGNSFGTTCTESGSTAVYYCAVPLADTALVIRATKTYFDTNTDTSFGTDRTVDTGAQVATTMNNVAYSALAGFTAVSASNGSALNLSWTPTGDTNFTAYQVYYLPSASGVTNTNGTAWNNTNDAAMNTRLTSSTAIPSLICSRTYYLTIYVLDSLGNRSLPATEVSRELGCGGAVAIVVPQSSTGQGIISSSLGGSISKQLPNNQYVTLMATPGVLPDGFSTAQITVDSQNKNTLKGMLPKGAHIVGDLMVDVGVTLGENNPMGVGNFKNAIILDFNYSDAQAQGFNENTFKVYRYDQVSKSWQTLSEILVESSSNRIRVATRQPGIFAVVGGSTGQNIVSTVNTVSNPSTISTATNVVFRNYLKFGSENEEVKMLQQKLHALGYFPAGVEFNGHFGPTTKKAVVNFQKANGLDPIGVVGPATRTLLNSSN